MPGETYRTERPRRSLPNRRHNNTFPLQTAEMSKPMLVTVGYFDDGAPAEVFVSDVKAGTAMDALARDAAVILSIAMQHRVPLETLQKAVTRNSDDTPSSVLGQLIDMLVAEQPRRPPSSGAPAPAPVTPVPSGGGSPAVAELVT